MQDKRYLPELKKGAIARPVSRCPRYLRRINTVAKACLDPRLTFKPLHPTGPTLNHRLLPFVND